jgi:hypothetical protein
VEKYKQIPPYPETQNYVNQVSKRYAAAQKQAAAHAETLEPAVVAPAPEVVEEKHPKLEQFIDENGRLHLKTTQ